MLSKIHRLPIQDFFGLKAPKPRQVARNQGFSVRVYGSTRKYSRFGVVVSKKIADKASARVKIKRLVFNFIRLHKKSIFVADYLIIPSADVLKLPPLTIQQNLSDLLLTLN